MKNDDVKDITFREKLILWGLALLFNVAIFSIPAFLIVNSRVKESKAQPTGKIIRLGPPEYRYSEDYKEKQMAEIPKISVDEVQEGNATITKTIKDARSDDLYNAPVQIGETYCEKITQVEVYGVLDWSVYKDGSGEVGSHSKPRGWEVIPQDLTGTHSTTCMTGEPGYDDPPADMVALLVGDITCDVKIPDNAQPGTYSAVAYYDMQWNDFSIYFQFKITPPCPAGVTLTITPQGG